MTEVLSHGGPGEGGLRLKGLAVIVLTRSGKRPPALAEAQRKHTEQTGIMGRKVVRQTHVLRVVWKGLVETQR